MGAVTLVSCTFSTVGRASQLQAWAVPSPVADGADDPKKGLLRRTTLSLAASLVVAPTMMEAPARAAETWRDDIKLGVEALELLNKKLQTIPDDGTARRLAEFVRKTLYTSYSRPMLLTVPAGQSLGVTVADTGKVLSLESASSVFREGDIINEVDGTSVESPDLLKKLVKNAKNSAEPLQILVERTDPTPLKEFERKLKKAYLDLGDPELPDLDDMSVKYGDLLSLSVTAATSPSASDLTLREVRRTLGELLPDLTAVAKAL